MSDSRERLPTLFEVLNRMSAPPVDLWSFYEFMRKNYRGVQYLDFWLDVANHIKLCQQYVQGCEIEHLPGVDENGLLNDSSGSDPSSQGRRSHFSVASPSSEVLLNMLSEGAFESPEPGFSNRNSPIRRSYNVNYSGVRSGAPSSTDKSNGGGAAAGAGGGANSIHDASARKRDTVARLSALLDDFQKRHGDLPPDQQQDDVESGETEYEDLGIQRRNPRSSSRLTVSGYTGASLGSDLGSGFGLDKINFDLDHDDDDEDADDEGHIGMSRTPVLNQPYERVPGGSPTRQLSPSHSPVMRASDREKNSDPISPLRDPAIAPFTRRGASAGAGPGAGPGAGAGPNHRSQRKRSAMTAKPVSLDDIYASVNSIMLRYLTAGGEREIVFPGQMARTICNEASGAGRRNPALFNEARDYVFEVLEREAYPAFLTARALSNFGAGSALLRLLGGLISLFGAFWLGFVFILLNWQPKSHRLWVLLPFAVGWYLTISSLYRVDCVLGLLGYGEGESSRPVMKIQEHYVRQLVRGRSLFVAILTTVVVACFVVLFVLVPGHRL